MHHCENLGSEHWSLKKNKKHQSLVRSNSLEENLTFGIFARVDLLGVGVGKGVGVGASVGDGGGSDVISGCVVDGI